MDEESNAVNTEVVQDTTPTESAPAEKETSEADPILDILSDENEVPSISYPKEESTKEPEGEESTTEPEESKEEEPVVEPEKPSKADERKQQLNTEIRELVEMRNKMQQEIESYKSQTMQQQTVEKLEAEGYSEVEIENIMLKQQMEAIQAQAQTYQQSAQITSQLTLEANRVLNEFPIFNDASPDYIPELAEQAAELLENSIVRDANGQIIGATLTPYQIYKPIADAHRLSSMQGQIRGQKATEKMLSSVDAPSSAPPKPAKVKDPIMEMLAADD